MKYTDTELRERIRKEIKIMKEESKMKGTEKQIQYANDIIEQMLDGADVKGDKKAQLKDMLIAKEPKAVNWIGMWTDGQVSKYKNDAIRMRAEIGQVIKG